MSIPGSNLLGKAMRLVQPQKIPFYAVTGKTKNALYQDIDQIEKLGDFAGSVQPISATKYQAMGLDFKKSYVSVWISLDQTVLSREATSGFIVWQGRRFQFVGKTDWFGQDGWTKTFAVDVGVHQ